MKTPGEGLRREDPERRKSAQFEPLQIQARLFPILLKRKVEFKIRGAEERPRFLMGAGKLPSLPSKVPPKGLEKCLRELFKLCTPDLSDKRLRRRKTSLRLVVRPLHKSPQLADPTRARAAEDCAQKTFGSVYSGHKQQPISPSPKRPAKSCRTPEILSTFLHSNLASPFFPSVNGNQMSLRKPILSSLSITALFATSLVPVTMAQEAVVELATFEVTALHFPELSVKVPSAISILEGNDLTDYGAATIPEVLRSGAGVISRSLSGTASQATIDIRSMGGTANQRVLTLVNGRRLNRPDLGQINWLQILPGDVARIEVYRGGQGVIYGDNAMGGLIKIETVTPSEPGLALGLNFGSENLRSASLSAETQVPSGGLRVSTSFLEQDGYRDHSEVSVSNLGGMLALQLNDWSSETSLQYSQQNTELPGAVVSFGFPETPRAAQNMSDFVREKNFNFDEVVRGSLTDTLALEVIFNLSQRHQETFFFSYTENDLRSLSLSPRFHYTTGPVEWVFGVDVSEDKLDVSIFSDEAKSSLNNDAEVTRKAYAGYLHATYDLTASTSLRAGIRHQSVQTKAVSTPGSSTVADFDEDSTHDLDAATVGLNQRFGSAVRVWARWDQLFRYPVTDEIASYQGFLLNPPFNVDLRPEKGDGYEIGGQIQAGDFLLSGNLFLIELEDEITFFTDPVTFASANVNLPATQRKGAEISLRYEGDHFRASASWTGLNAAFTAGPNDGATPPLIPRHQVKLSLDLDLTERLRFGARALYLSKQYEDQYLDTDFDQPFGAPNADPYLPESFVTDTYLNFTLYDNVSLQLTITNLFDRDYAAYKLTTFNFANPDADAWYPAPGIGWRLSGQFQW